MPGSADRDRAVRRLSALSFLGGIAIFAAACGTPGVPLPPSLELPLPVKDLRAVRKGDHVTLTWTAPVHTTERRNLDQGGSFEICRSQAALKTCGNPVARIAFEKPTGTQDKNASARLQTYTDQVAPLQSDAAAEYFYAVSVQNSYKRTAGLSNQVQVSAAPTLAPPADFRAQLAPEGVKLTWGALQNVPQAAGLRFEYRVYRRAAGSNQDVIAGESAVTASAGSGITDSSMDWEHTYDYRLTVVTILSQPDGSEIKLEGEDSLPITVVTHDVFPPAVPSGLQAVFSGPGQKAFVDLVWSPDTEPDLAGYYVYRSEAGSPPQKLNQQPLKSPEFRDAEVSSGHNYEYSVSAIDVRGNESGRSQTASESVP